MESKKVRNRRIVRRRKDVSPFAFTVPEFCAAHRISRALFYILARDGRAPAVIKAWRRTIISTEAAASWRARMEAASAGDAR